MIWLFAHVITCDIEPRWLSWESVRLRFWRSLIEAWVSARMTISMYCKSTKSRWRLCRISFRSFHHDKWWMRILLIKEKSRFQLNKQLWKRVNLFWSTIVTSFIGWCDYQWKACFWIERRTFHSQSEYHTSRQTGHFWLRCIPHLSDVSIHEKKFVVLLLTESFYLNPIQQNKWYDYLHTVLHVI